MTVRSLEQLIDIFFLNPAEKVSGHEHGTLYLLRRDILSLENGPIWPATMMVLAGIDLLGKFYAGTDDGEGGVRGRFCSFIKKWFELDDDDSEVIFQLRNSMLHSFGLFSKKRVDGSMRLFHFTVTFDNGPLIDRRQNNSYWVNLKALRAEFERSILRYRNALTVQSELKAYFERMYGTYGSVWIGRVS